MTKGQIIMIMLNNRYRQVTEEYMKRLGIVKECTHYSSITSNSQLVEPGTVQSAVMGNQQVHILKALYQSYFGVYCYGALYTWPYSQTFKAIQNRQQI